MSRDLHILLAGVLIALLAVTGQALAVAQTGVSPAGQMVICTGQGPVVVVIGADGSPEEQPRYCPEHASVLLTAISAVQTCATCRTHVFELSTGREEVSRTGLARAAPRARGPPRAL